jgi:hypothetical protein
VCDALKNKHNKKRIILVKTKTKRKCLTGDNEKNKERQRERERERKRERGKVLTILYYQGLERKKKSFKRVRIITFLL